MSNNQFNTEYEEPINKDIGYPYNILPKGYPDKISDIKIKNTVQLLLENLRPNAGVQSIVDLHTTLINLGQNELNNRINDKVSRRAHFLSIISLIVALTSLLISFVQISKSVL